MENTKIIKYPSSTEKSLRMMESENTLVFVVERTANKAMIKEAIETMFKAKVVKVNTAIFGKDKKAYVSFSAETPAIDIATNLGLM